MYEEFGLVWGAVAGFFSGAGLIVIVTVATSDRIVVARSAEPSTPSAPGPAGNPTVGARPSRTTPDGSASFAGGLR